MSTRCHAHLTPGLWRQVREAWLEEALAESGYSCSVGAPYARDIPLPEEPTDGPAAIAVKAAAEAAAAAREAAETVAAAPPGGASCFLALVSV